MPEQLPHQRFMTQDAVDAEFAAMLGLDAGTLSERREPTMLNGALHEAVGAAAVEHSGVYYEHRSPEEDRIAQEFVDEMNASPMSMTPEELEAYYSHVDKTLNPNLLEAGFNTVDSNLEERRQQMALAEANAQAIVTARAQREAEYFMASEAARDDQNSKHGTPNSYIRKKRNRGIPTLLVQELTFFRNITGVN